MENLTVKSSLLGAFGLQKQLESGPRAEGIKRVPSPAWRGPDSVGRPADWGPVQKFLTPRPLRVPSYFEGL